MIQIFSADKRAGQPEVVQEVLADLNNFYDYYLIIINLCWLRLRGVYKSRWDIGVNGCTKFEIIVCNKCMIVGGVL